MYCPECGKECADTAKFCGACGYGLSGHQTPKIPHLPETMEFLVVRGDFGRRRGWRRVKARLQDGRLLLDGRGVLFKRPTVEIPLFDIVNVTADAQEVRFQRFSVKSAETNFVLYMKNAEEAERLKKALPHSQTPEFVAETAKHEAFITAYHTVTPHVFVTPLMAALSVIVYLMMGIRGAGWINPSAGSLLEWGGNYWVITTAGEWWRLLTAGFLHSGFLHLFMNMQALLVTGFIVERLYGNRLFGLSYVFGLVASSLVSIWWDHTHVVVGASGAVFAVYGALLAFMVRQQSVFSKRVKQQFGSSAATFVGYNLLFGVTQTGISNAAHVGGLAAGFMLGLIVSLPLDQASRAFRLWRATLWGLTVSLATLTVLVVAMPKSWVDLRSETALVQESNRISGDETRVLQEYTTILENFDKQKMTAIACAQHIDDHIIPAWDQVYSGILAIIIPEHSVSERQWQALMVDFYRLRRDIMREMAEAMREFRNDSKRVATFNKRFEGIAALEERAAAKVAELRAFGQERADRIRQGK